MLVRTGRTAAKVMIAMILRIDEDQAYNGQDNNHQDFKKCGGGGSMMWMLRQKDYVLASC